ncbi:unnamed protein product [Paramecium pentaurelia]|uniref:Transmembrane protein n=1 Tax=Paramecium pentaurelia TaxID=43138 RepID=A0A8S1XFD3_9CILI|nr:unnamed protein product [Paramecium pentaurelia]
MKRILLDMLIQIFFNVVFIIIVITYNAYCGDEKIVRRYFFFQKLNSCIRKVEKSKIVFYQTQDTIDYQVGLLLIVIQMKMDISRGNPTIIIKPKKSEQLKELKRLEFSVGKLSQIQYSCFEFSLINIGKQTS